MEKAVDEDHLDGLIAFMCVFSEKMGLVGISEDLFDKSREKLREMATEGFWWPGNTFLWKAEGSGPVDKIAIISTRTVR